MSRRDLTIWLAGVLAVALLGLGALVRVPYVSLSPGPAIDTLGTADGTAHGAPILGITGAKTYPTDGQLELTTVSVRDQIRLWQALRGWLSSGEAVIPREFIYPEHQTDQQNQAQNQQEMTESQDNATDAALSELGLATLSVDSVSKGGAAVGKLRPGDVLVSVDGTKATGPGSLRRLVRAHRVGDEVVVGIVRDGSPLSVTMTTGKAKDDPKQSALGIITKISSRIKVDIKLKDIGGPSAGLMFTLGIIDKLTPGSLTGGRNIAGTGTIDVDGTVGQIGGIAEKLLGARRVGATVFLVPDANCAEAAKNRPDGLTLIRVKDLDGALAGLSAVRAGRTAPSC